MNEYNNRAESEKLLICGIHPVREAILAKKSLDKILIQKDIQNPQMSELKQLIKENRIPVQFVPIERLNRTTHTLHQGVIAMISMISYVDLETILDAPSNPSEQPLFLILDRITDVRNFGAIARTAECAGVNAIIFPEHDSAKINQDAIKTSAGALLRIPLCRVSNLKTTLNYLRASGVKLIAATEMGQTPYTQADCSQSLAIIMGSEENGVSKDFLRMADELVVIPMRGEIDSLNVSVAAGILLYEVIRQRNIQ